MGSLDYLYQVVWVLVPASLVVREVVVVLVMVVGVGVLVLVVVGVVVIPLRRRLRRRRTLDFILHDRFNIFNDASLTRTIHD